MVAADSDARTASVGAAPSRNLATTRQRANSPRTTVGRTAQHFPARLRRDRQDLAIPAKRIKPDTVNGLIESSMVSEGRSLFDVAQRQIEAAGHFCLGVPSSSMEETVAAGAVLCFPCGLKMAPISV